MNPKQNLDPKATQDGAVAPSVGVDTVFEPEAEAKRPRPFTNLQGDRTEEQTKKLTELGYVGELPAGKQEASDLITKLTKEAKDASGEKRPRPFTNLQGDRTEEQTKKLTELGYVGELPAGKQEASDLITKIKAEQKSAANAK
jgi:hypothetical protein